MDTPVWVWLAVVGVIIAMLAVDLLAHRRAHVIGVREAAGWSAAWVAAGVGFGVVVWQVWGADRGGEYFAGYLIEKSLAVDNVFIWAILLTYFAVPRQYQHRVLFLGVVGALVFRGAFVAVGAVLIERFSWVLYLFGAFLLITGYRMLRARNEHIDPTRSRTLRLFRRWVPMTDAYHGQRLLVRRGGVLLATPLLAVLVLVEVTDIIFAVDSIPAIFAVTDEPFLVFTANAFAVLGLRAMYFLLADLVHRFVYLKVGLALVLVWVGIKMILKIDVLYVPDLGLPDGHRDDPRDRAGREPARHARSGPAVRRGAGRAALPVRHARPRPTARAAVAAPAPARAERAAPPSAARDGAPPR